MSAHRLQTPRDLRRGAPISRSRPTAGRHAWTAGLAALAVACSTYQPFDSTANLREGYATRLGEDQAKQLEVPYELTTEIIDAVGARLSPAGGERQRADDIQDFVFNWLDLDYSLTPTRNAAETFRSRQGNCMSFVNLFVGIARYQRLNAFYVEVIDHQKWNYRDGVVLSQGHIVGGIYLDGRLSTFDFLPYRPKSYRDFNPIDDITAAAHYFNNLGAEALISGDLASAEANLAQAVELAPDFDKAINNFGLLLIRRGEMDRALDLYRRGLEIDPKNVALLTNMARAYQQIGRGAEAVELLGRIEETKQTSPYFFVYRGELELAENRLDSALEYMAKALRMDSEVPEVHIGLAKVYMALGEIDKVRHHVQRALKLDATHAEARDLARMLTGLPGG